MLDSAQHSDPHKQTKAAEKIHAKCLTNFIAGDTKKSNQNAEKMAHQMEVGVQDFVLLDEITLEKFMENLHKR